VENVIKCHFALTESRN